MEQTELFGTPPHKLVRRHDPDTSHEAAQKVDTTKLERRVYECILAAGKWGMISDEIRASLTDVRSYSSVTARYAALKEKGLIVYSGDLRSGNSGRNQHVMVATSQLSQTA